MESSVTLTENAMTKLKDIFAEENNPNLKLRIAVNGGGCSGFSYGFQFDETVNDDDYVTNKDGITLLVDSISYQYLTTATVDFVEELAGSSFVISNPNASSTCGCGSSFSM